LKIFQYILEDIGVDDPLEWTRVPPDSAIKMEPGTGSTEITSNSDVFKAMKHLLTEFPKLDIYFRDRDGQSLMHYIAKDGYTEVLEYLVNKGYNPLCRDRTGRTAWDLAYRKWSRQCDKKPTPREVSPNLINKYILQAPAKFPLGRSDSETNGKIISVVQLHEEGDPWNKIRFSLQDFFTDSPCWSDEGYSAIAANVRGDTSSIWIQLDENNVSDSSPQCWNNV
jgi:hypothetical protein